ncbi:hypothetical protein KF946_07865 [Idiomarina loihiensis]|uniref:hypothetical protein n=1 Tax=Idiomarina loihiensis TaxID=135577 RepID=UPI00129CB4BF|nr:hypothetical protein [Idiomarina loihiensis]MRJ43382.1 hypothetical protein [Idiomarina loihiensis]UTW31954.1 hypothetical protein KF946_07865 [Idiomarina loihiensis]
MKYLAILLACLSIASFSSTAQDTEAEASKHSSAKAENQYKALNLLEQLQLFQYAQDYRNKCVRPSESFYYALGVLEKKISDEGAQPSSEDIRGIVTSVIDKIQAVKGKSKIERPELEFASSSKVLSGLEVISERCVEQTLNYFKDLSDKYAALSEGKEFPSDTSALRAYLEAKSRLLLRSYSIETNEYRLHPDTDIFTLDGYTEFMFRVYQFMVASNALMAEPELKQELREELMSSFQQIKEARKKIEKDFGVFNGLQLVFKLAKDKEGKPVDFSADFKTQKEAINEYVDIFYPFIEEINAQVESPEVDLNKVAQLMLRLDNLLTLHERRVSKVRVEVTKTLDAMITQAK